MFGSHMIRTVLNPNFIDKLLLCTIIFTIGGFVWGVLALPDPHLLLYFFSVNDIMICSKVSFRYGLCCKETGELICVGCCLYNTGGC